ncbi:MAG: helix-turn-helix domain-containing protein [Hyphomicrobiaceae bacterium]
MIFNDYATQAHCETKGHRRTAPSAAVVPKPEAVLTREFLCGTVATVFNVEAELLAHPKRGPAHVALARQVAMYLAHVSCELSLTAVGRLFGRDRSTVAHACRRIENAREGPLFDRALAVMERSVRMVVQTSAALRRDLTLVERGGGR